MSQELVAPPDRPKTNSAILMLAALMIIMAGMKVAESIINPILLALFLAAISSPGYFWLLKKKLPVGLALSLVLLSLLLFGSVMSALISGSVIGFTENLPVYQERLTTIWSEVLTLLQNYGIALDLSQLSQFADTQRVVGLAGNALNGLISVFTGAFFILLLLMFILIEMTTLQKKISAISSNPDQSMLKMDTFFKTLNQYFAMKTAVSFGTGLLVYCWLLIFDIDYPILWALIAFMLNFVPTIGSLIAALPAVLLGLIQFGFGTALWVAFGYFLVNNLVGNVIEPRIMGKRLGLSVLVVFLSLVVWGWLLGPVGMFLSVPLTMTAKIALESNPHTAWIGIALGDGSDIK